MRALSADVVSVADDDGGEHQHAESQEKPAFRLFARALPLAEEESPDGAEENDGGHVESPGTELVVAHLCLTHGVEEELEIPDHPGCGGEEVVEEQGDAANSVILCAWKFLRHFDSGGIGRILDGGLVFAVDLVAHIWRRGIRIRCGF